MLPFCLGLIGVLISLIGWFIFDSIFLLTIGTFLYVVEIILERKKLNFGAKLTDIIVFGIGCLIAVIIRTPFYIGGMIAINCYSALICLLTIPPYTNQLKSFFKLINK